MTNWRHGKTYSLYTIKCCKEVRIEGILWLLDSHVGVFSCSFDTILLLYWHTKLLGFSFSFLLVLKT